jgi:hypothetical protein
MRLAVALATLIGTATTGCIEIEGGAVELSWSLRTFGGSAVGSCGDVGIQNVRLCWQTLGDGSPSTEDIICQAGLRRTFDCSDSSGVTGFDLDPGPTAFWIEPVCQDGAPADSGTYEVPPPIVRTVQEGKIVSLSSLLLVVSPLSAGCPAAGCTCERQ